MKENGREYPFVFRLEGCWSSVKDHECHISNCTGQPNCQWFEPQTDGSPPCSETIGDRLSHELLPAQIGFGSVLLLVCLFFGIGFVRHCRARRGFLKRIYGLGCLGSACSIFAIIDPFGVYGIIPFWVYFVFDEFSAGSVFSIVVLIMDNMLKMSAMKKNSKFGLPKPALWGLISVAWVNLIGVKMLAIVMSSVYTLCSAIKDINLGLLIIACTFTVRRSASKMIAVLKQSDTKKKTKIKKKNSTKRKQKNSSKSMIAKLAAKMRRVYFGCGMAAVVLICAGIIDLTSSEFGLYVDANQVDLYFYIFRCIYVLAFILILENFPAFRLCTRAKVKSKATLPTNLSSEESSESTESIK